MIGFLGLDDELLALAARKSRELQKKVESLDQHKGGGGASEDSNGHMEDGGGQEEGNGRAGWSPHRAMSMEVQV